MTEGFKLVNEGRSLYYDRSDLHVADETELAAHAVFDRPRDVGIVAQELFGVLASLAKPLSAVREPRAALFDDPLVDADVDEIAKLRDAFAVHHVEFGLAEGRCDFVLDH